MGYGGPNAHSHPLSVCLSDGLIYILTLCLSGSVYFENTLLAVWRHGWQRRGEGPDVLQEIIDPKKTYRLVGSDRYVCLYTFMGYTLSHTQNQVNIVLIDSLITPAG